MIDTIITIVDVLAATYDASKCISSLMFGNKQDKYLQQIATDMKDMKVHIERLSDTILYAVNLDGVHTLDTHKPQYFNDLREIRQLLEPLQHLQKEPLLASAMISAPPPMVLKNPRHVLQDISPLEYITIPIVDHPWEPMLFQEKGIYYVGWQTPNSLAKLGCQYPSHWALNNNVLPQNQLAESHPLVLHPNKPKPDEPKSPNKRKSGKSKGGTKPSAKLDKVFRDPLKDGGEGPEMIIIPAGRFRMGDIRNTGSANEKPVHQVSVKSFAMGRYPITFAEYDLFCEAKNREKPSERGLGRDDNRPVINVSWDDAVAYLNWLTAQTGKPYRLPSEAEWEYAARAGTDTDYWWGNEIGQNRANCRDSGWGGKKTSPVGSFEANPFGLYDTVGNVWEWCADPWHENYEKAPTDGHIWQKAGENRRLLRGGSFLVDPNYCRAAIRNRVSSGNYNGNRGFRGCADLAL
ncbi:MAG: formylglycine-generating enzyme family protein [Candidatus Parabeggiatoa sp.]|nr:formylglycine-generating enzyme family protein [Candidatus Parabeggiatoa sp.]